MQLKPKKRKRKKRANTYHCQHYKDWATIGRKVIINGKEHTVYSKGKLVDAFANYGIPRTPTTFYLWERAGILPKSPIYMGGKGYYTKGMIECIALTALECGIGKCANSIEFFKKQVWENFNKVVNKELFDGEA